MFRVDTFLELLHSLQVMEVQQANAQNLIEFYKNQLEQWKQVHNEQVRHIGFFMVQKEHWKKEVEVASEHYIVKLKEAQIEIDHLHKQLDSERQRKNNLQV